MRFISCSFNFTATASGVFSSADSEILVLYIDTYRYLMAMSFLAPAGVLVLSLYLWEPSINLRPTVLYNIHMINCRI
jgi:hypothetical protein